MISKIELRHVLPRVFSMSRDEVASRSQVWLKDIAFTAPGGYMIEADSGTGKSSLCSFIYGNRNDYEGQILMDGRDARRFSVSDWCRVRRTEIALLPQEMRLFPELTALENVLIKNRLTGYKTRDEIMGMLERLEVAEKADVPVGRMSIGQQQRVAVVRALCQPFSFLLLDEPVSHLDARNNATVAALVADEVAARGACLIATSVGNRIDLPLQQVKL